MCWLEFSWLQMPKIQCKQLCYKDLGLCVSLTLRAGMEPMRTAGTCVLSGHSLSLTLVLSSAFAFSLWIGCQVSSSQGRTHGPMCVTPGSSVLSFLLPQRDRFPQVHFQNYWGGRGLWWLWSDVHPGPIH